MIDKTKKYRTRDGREVRIYATDGRPDYPVHGAVKEEEGWHYEKWMIDGRCYKSDDHCEDDLVELGRDIKIVKK